MSMVVSLWGGPRDGEILVVRGDLPVLVFHAPMEVTFDELIEPTALVHFVEYAYHRTEISVSGFVRFEYAGERVRR